MRKKCPIRLAELLARSALEAEGDICERETRIGLRESRKQLRAPDRCQGGKRLGLKTQQMAMLWVL